MEGGLTIVVIIIIMKYGYVDGMARKGDHLLYKQVVFRFHVSDSKCKLRGLPPRPVVHLKGPQPDAAKGALPVVDPPM